MSDMYELMTRLNEISKQAAESLVDKSHIDPDVGVMCEMVKHETGVTVSKYDIISEKVEMDGNLNKRFYSIIDNKTNDVIYTDLGLFETAMGIVKNLLYTDDSQKINRILELDQSYVAMIVEINSHRCKLRHLVESTNQHDILTAKYTNAKTKLSAVKLKLLQIL